LPLSAFFQPKNPYASIPALQILSGAVRQPPKTATAAHNAAANKKYR